MFFQPANKIFLADRQNLCSPYRNVDGVRGVVALLVAQSGFVAFLIPHDAEDAARPGAQYLADDKQR